MKWNVNYDERQILARGKACRYGFIAAVLTFVLIYLVQDAAGLALDGSTILKAGIMLPLTVCMLLMILWDAYDYVDSTYGRTGLSALGVAGILLIGYCLYEVLFAGQRFYWDGMVTEHVGNLLMGCCMVFIGVVYWIKQILDKQKPEEE